MIEMLIITFVIVITLMIINLYFVITTPKAGKLFVDKNTKQAYIGFSNVDLDKLRDGGYVKLTIKEISIPKEQSMQ